MTELELFEAMGSEHGWVMPRASWWKRRPVVRHVRAKWLQLQIARHNSMWRLMGAIPSGYDSWVIFGIWSGKERHD